MPTKMCLDCEVCQDKKKVPDPLREGEMIRCMECADAPALREIDEMDCPYCGHEQDSDDWREWIPDPARLWVGQGRSRIYECAACEREFGWSYEVELAVKTWQIDNPDGTPSEDSEQLRGEAELTREKEAEPTKEEWLRSARATLRNHNAMTCGFGVIIPLPMDAQDLMRATDAARALGFGLVSPRIAERVEPLFGPVLAVTQAGGLEDAWLDFLRGRQEAKR